MAKEPVGPRDNRSEVSRRDFASMVVMGVAAVALAGLASVSMAMRYLRPKMTPFNFIQAPDKANVPNQVVATVAELQEPWKVKDFIFRQVNIEYTPRGQQQVEIPGFAVRLPDEAGQADTKYIEVYSRICPHLGCIFNFETEPDLVQKNYGGFRPPGPVFACPCHLSIYDVAHDGKVISGPAPRPPYKFQFKLEGDDVIVTAPPGGLA
ncbi:MAG: Rieske 2Fe-2S domain-containing protein [Fimbriimonadaceae bacterium]|nr:Rieske 2Fe-2S domain-containing protein [Fimbriimonadaceae bacterium]